MAPRYKEKGVNLKRPYPFMMRLNKIEFAELDKRSKAAGLSMSQYCRCRIFDIPFEQVGGTSPKRRSIPVGVAQHAE